MKNIFSLILVFFLISQASAQRGEEELLVSIQQSSTTYLPHPNDNNANPEVNTGDASAFLPDEVNAVPDLQNNFGVTELSIADTTNGYGEYVGALRANDGSNDRGQLGLPVENGSTYNWYLIYRMEQGTKGRFRWAAGSADGDDNVQNLSATTWTVLSGTVTTSSTNLRPDIYACTTGAVNDEIWFKLSLEKQ